MEESIEELRALRHSANSSWDGRYEWHDEDLSGVDFRGVPLSLGSFYDCDFSRANFKDADLSDTEFENCNLGGSNPEDAASLDQAVFRAPIGLAESQIDKVVERDGKLDR